MKNSKVKRFVAAHKKIEQKKIQIKNHSENMDKIRNHPNTVKIKYPEYKESFDYVDDLFPGSNVKEVEILKVGPKMLERLGYGGAGGFYCKVSKAIVISSYMPKPKKRYPSRYNFAIKAKLFKDEVIVQELCHYCCVEEGNIISSKYANEEFAYGWSIGYLRQKGYSDDEIIKNNFFPFLVESKSEKALDCVLKLAGMTRKEYSNLTDYKMRSFFKRYGPKWNKKRKELAYEYGREIIVIYNKKLEEGTYSVKKKKEFDRFDILDL